MTPDTLPTNASAQIFYLDRIKAKPEMGFIHRITPGNAGGKKTPVQCVHFAGSQTGFQFRKRLHAHF